MTSLPLLMSDFGSSFRMEATSGTVMVVCCAAPLAAAPITTLSGFFGSLAAADPEQAASVPASAAVRMIAPAERAKRFGVLCMFLISLCG